MYDKSVSVIIPVYNVESCLRRCLDSVFGQTHNSVQVIVVNDGSTDRTVEVARDYSHDILYFEQRNEGPAVARNVGLRMANGDFVAFLDADDYWLPDFLRVGVDFLVTHPEAVAVNTAHLNCRWGKLHHRGPAGLLKQAWGQDGYMLENFFDTWAVHDHVRTGSVLLRREVVEKAGPQLEIRIGEDLEYWGYIATFGPWGFIPEPLWVGDSHDQAAKAGWLQRYRKRRGACPTVEEWEHRIVPRLKESDWQAFRIARGRVAKCFAHTRVLVGDYADARAIVLQHGRDFPQDQTSNILQRGIRGPFVVWRCCCYLLRCREYLKALLIWLTNKANVGFARGNSR